MSSTTTPSECTRCANLRRLGRPIACVQPAPGAACSACFKSHRQCSFRQSAPRPGSSSRGSGRGSARPRTSTRSRPHKRTRREDSFVVSDSDPISIHSDSSPSPPPSPHRRSRVQRTRSPSAVGVNHMSPAPNRRDFASIAEWGRATRAWAARHNVNVGSAPDPARFPRPMPRRAPSVQPEISEPATDAHVCGTR